MKRNIFFPIATLILLVAIGCVPVAPTNSPVLTQATLATTAIQPELTEAVDIPTLETVPPTSFLYPTDAYVNMNGLITEGNACIISDEHTRVFVSYILALREILPLHNNMRAIACFFATATDVPPAWYVITPPLNVYTSVVLVGRLDGLETPAINMQCTDCGAFVTYDNWELLASKEGSSGINYDKMKEVAQMIAERSITTKEQIYYIP